MVIRFEPLLVFSIVFLLVACKKKCIPHSFSFSIAAKAYPDRDSIFTGDTIWIELDEPSTLLDRNSNTMVNYSEAGNLGTAIGFRELLGNSMSREAANDFNFVLSKGNAVPNSNTTHVREFIFSESGSRYQFKLGIIPAKVGIYRISLSGASNVYKKNDACSNASFSINFKETNQHMYFNEWNYGVIVPLPNSGYCFKVK